MKEGIDYLTSVSGALSHPATRFYLWLVGGAFVLAPLATLSLTALGKISEKTRRDVWVRLGTWLVIAPAMLVPVVLCPATAMMAVSITSLLCYREYARATGLFRDHLLSTLVVVGIVALTIASLDHWYNFFSAVTPLTVVVIAAVGVLSDTPHGYIQRVSLACTGFLLLGTGLGHLGYMANDAGYRPVLLLVMISTQLNDIFAYVCGKSFGKRKVFPNTSPNKTLGGHLGALVLTTAFAAATGSIVFRDTNLASPVLLVALGLIISVGGQLGDLVLGSIKRDLGIKDMAATLPGHGGFLDRMNSSMLVAPAAFHFIGYFNGFGLDRGARVLSGWFGG